MRVAIVSSAYVVSPADSRTAPELVFDVASRAVAESGLPRSAIELTVSASSDVLDGRSFGFAYALEALGVCPPTLESHLEMDGAWAAYYAWIELLAGAASTALVVSWGKCSEAPVSRVTNNQLDPFCLAPLGLDHVTTAALQADAWMRRTNTSDKTLDDVVRRARESAGRNASVQAMPRAVGDAPVASPLHRRHCAQPADGACAIVLAAEHVVVPDARGRRVWIAGADHRSESGALGCRDLAALPSATRAVGRAREIAGWAPDVSPDVVELSAPFAHQEPMLLEALGVTAAHVNPSGGALVADPMMTTGLIRIAECAAQLAGRAGEHQVPAARRGLAHAAGGHALQQNLVFLLEADDDPDVGATANEGGPS